MKKKQFYEKPSMEVVEFEHIRLLTASLKDHDWHDEPEEAPAFDLMDDFDLM